MSLLNTLSLPLGDSEAAVVPGLGGSGLPPSPVPEQHAGGEHGGWGRIWHTFTFKLLSWNVTSYRKAESFVNCILIRSITMSF